VDVEVGEDELRGVKTSEADMKKEWYEISLVLQTDTSLNEEAMMILFEDT